MPSWSHNLNLPVSRRVDWSPPAPPSASRGGRGLQIFDPREILNQQLERLRSILRRDTQNGRRVHGHQYLRSPTAFEKFPAIGEHLPLRSEERTHRGTAEAHDQTRRH